MQLGFTSAEPRVLGREGTLGVCWASEVLPYGQWRRTTDTISVAVTSSPSKSFLLSPALVQSAVIPRGMGSTHTDCTVTVQSHSSRWPTPAMSPSEQRHTFWGLPPQRPLPFFFQSATAPTGMVPLHSPRCKYLRRKHNLGPQPVHLPTDSRLSFSAYHSPRAWLEEQTHSLSHALESLIFCQTEMKNKPNLSCHRIVRCLWQFYQSMKTRRDALKKWNCSLSSVIYKQHWCSW